MATFATDKASTSSSDRKGAVPDRSYALDEKRRAALAEVDNAKFSSVSLVRRLSHNRPHLDPRLPLDGST